MLQQSSSIANHGKPGAIACGTSTFSRLRRWLFHSNLPNRNPQTIFSVFIVHNGISKISSGSDTIFLIDATRDDADNIVGQRPLQRLCLIPRCAHPDIALFVRRQDHRHSLWVDRLDHGVRRRRQETVDEMWAGNWFRFGAAIAFEFGPNSGEGEQGPVVVQGNTPHAMTPVCTENLNPDVVMMKSAEDGE